MEEDKRGYIRFLYKRRNLNITQIARKMGLSRQTVRRAIRGGEKPQKKQRKSKLDSYKQEIQSILKDNSYISNVLILEKIKEKGYQGGRSILGDYLHELRKIKKGSYINIETLPGEEAQVDWAYCGDTSCGDHKRRLYLFCMALSYSRYLYMEFTVSMSLDTLLACHIHAFNFFGGIPKSILYDNMKTVVSARYGREISFNARFLDFTAYYGFNPKVCNIRRANEKGKVERVIRYIKNNFLSGYNSNFSERCSQNSANSTKGSNYEHIRAKGMIWLNKTANRRVHSVTRKIPEEYFLSEEKEHLLLIPDSPYDYAEPQPKKVHKTSLLEFETNKYSLPSDYANRTVILKAYLSELKILNSQYVIIANHKRCYDKYRRIINPEHYKELTEKKKKAALNLRLRKFTALSLEAEEYLKGLTSRLRNVYFHVDRILELETIFGKTAVAQSIARALEHNAFGWEYIKNILLQSFSVTHKIKPGFNNSEELMNMDFDVPDLSLYDDIDKKSEGNNGL